MGPADEKICNEEMCNFATIEEIIDFLAAKGLLMPRRGCEPTAPEASEFGNLVMESIEVHR